MWVSYTELFEIGNARGKLSARNCLGEVISGSKGRYMVLYSKGMQSGLGTRVRSRNAKESGMISKGMQGKVSRGTGKWAKAPKASETRKSMKSVKSK